MERDTVFSDWKLNTVNISILLKWYTDYNIIKKKYTYLVFVLRFSHRANFGISWVTGNSFVIHNEPLWNIWVYANEGSTKSKWERKAWKLWICSQLGTSVGSLDIPFKLVSEGGQRRQSYGTEPLIYGVCATSRYWVY